MMFCLVNTSVVYNQEISAVFARTSSKTYSHLGLANSSMYYDEDGDLAHEFYEETIVTKNGRKRAKLKRIHKNLIPQGTVKLEHPRIHVDFPVIICEV